ncbi:TIGR04388 family protein [Leptospira fainei]|nr:TIGR04388 family protein [Leptospira fainei]
MRSQVVFFLLCFFVSLDSVFPQPAGVPQLNPQVYNWQNWSSQLQQSYSVANGSHNISNWDAVMLQSYAVLQSEWQAEIQMQISSSVSKINSQDSFMSVQDYKNYVYDALESQASSLLTQWQVDAERSIQLERNQFIDTFYSGNEAQVTSLKNHFDSEFQSFISGKSPSLSGVFAGNGNLLANSQISLQQLEQQWYSQFNSNIQNGLFNYQQALQSLNGDYAKLLNQINSTEAQYQAYLQQIQSYEASVKDQIKQTMDGYQQFLNSTDLFWNTASALYDSKANGGAGGYVSAPACTGNDICADYLYDVTSGQFTSSCRHGDVCITLRYDTSTQSYLSPTCPSGGDCSSNPSKNISIHTSLNGDGVALQNVINSIETAITQGMTSYGIFDSTTGKLLSYPQTCLNNGAVCSAGQFDLSQSKFFTSSVCPTGDICYNAVVDSTNPSAIAGLYYANSCPQGDANCIVCPSTGGSQDSCQIQSFEASLMYAAATMSSFLAREQGMVNSQLTNILSGIGGGGTQSIDLGGFDPFNHSLRPSHGPNTLYITTQDFLSGQFDLSKRTGLVGLAWEIVNYIGGGISETDFANWIMNAASAGNSSVCPGSSPGSGSPTISGDTSNSNDFDAGCLGQSLRGLTPGLIVTAISRALGQTDLIAFNDRNYIGNSFMIIEGGPNNWNQDPAYCHDWVGCFFNPFSHTPAIGDANQWFQQNQTTNSGSGNNFYNYTEDQAGGGGLLRNTIMTEDSIGIVLNYTTTDTNAHANALTWQAVSAQLQSFAYNWNGNIFPAISNWTSQVSTYQTQYLNWQKTEQSLLSQAQSDYSNALSGLQKSEMLWLTNMSALQSKANSDFSAANNKLRDSKNQSDSELLARELFGVLNPKNFQTGSSFSDNPSGFDLNPKTHSNLFNSALSFLEGVDARANLPSFSVLQGISDSFSNASTGVGNLSLLSSTNNALVNARSNYMQQLADSMKTERTFTQNGESNLLKDHGNLSTKEVGDTTYLVDNRGYFVHCNSSGNCTSCGTDVNDCAGSKATDIGAFLKNVCGEKLDSCNQYTRLKYSNVQFDKQSGTISLDQSVYSGKANDCGNSQDASTYCFEASTQHLTIHGPTFALGQGANSLGNIFDGNRDHGEDKIMSSFVGRTFENLNNFFANGNYTGSILASVNHLDSVNNYNSQAASNSASAQAHTANLIADYIQTVVFQQGSVQDFIKQETHNIVQSFIATSIANTFHLTPEAAAFLAGAYLDHEAYKAAERHLGILKPIDNMLKYMVLDGGTLNGAMGLEMKLSHADDLRAIQQWKDDKYAAYGQIVAEAMRVQNMPADQIALVMQVVTEYYRMKDAKMELGMRGAMLSLPRMEGMIHAMTASLGGAVAEVEGGFFKNIAHDLQSVGLVSERQERKFEKDLRYVIDDIKLVYDKNAIKGWQADVVAISKDAVQLYGKQQGLDPGYVNQVADMIGKMVSREQARSELRKLYLTEDILSVGGSALDRALFKGGLTSLSMQLVRGFLTSQADIGRSLGLFTNGQAKDFYKQTKDWSSNITGSALLAQSHQGDLDKHWWKQQERALVFDLIGKALDPNGDPAEQHLIGQLLQSVFDQREAKKRAREERVHEAAEAVEIAASVALTVFSAGAGSQTLVETLMTIGKDLKNLITLSGDASSLIRATAVVADVAAQTYVGSKDGGKNGAVAGFVNGLLSVMTLYKEIPITGFVSWTPHQNSDILYGTDNQKGGWGGGVVFALPGEGRLPINAGLTFTPGSGLDVNLNYNLRGGYLGIDYNFASGNYTANGGMDVWGDKSGLHHGGFSVSASKDGSASVGGYYNYGKGSTPPNMRGHGGTFTYSNDGRFTASGQILGGSAASVSYNTNSHRFEKVRGNENWQNEMLLSRVQESSNALFNRTGEKFAEPTGKALVTGGILSESDRVSIMQQEGGAQRILDLFDEHKTELLNGPAGERIRGDLYEIAELSGKRLELVNDSAKNPFDKFFRRLGGDFKRAFGIADSGLMSMDEDGNWKVSTCFDGSQEISTPKGNRRIDSVKVGEEVNTLNEETGEIEVKRITETYVHDVKSVHTIGYENNITVTTTWNHPFAVLNAGERNRNSGVEGNTWVKAEDLKTGDRSITKRSIRRAKLKTRLAKSSVLSAASLMIGENAYSREYQTNWETEREGTLGIRKVEEVIRSKKVYNIEVEGNHNYFIKVGDELVVVHNYPNSSAYELDKGIRLTEQNEKMASELKGAIENPTFFEKLFGFGKSDVNEEVKSKLQELKILMSQRDKFAESVGATESISAAKRSEKFVELLKTEEVAKQRVSDLTKLLDDTSLRLKDKTLLPEEIKGLKALSKYVSDKLFSAKQDLAVAEKTTSKTLREQAQKNQTKIQSLASSSFFEVRSNLDEKASKLNKELRRLQLQKESLESASRLNPKDVSLRNQIADISASISKLSGNAGGRYLELLKSSDRGIDVRASEKSAQRLSGMDIEIRNKIKEVISVLPKNPNGEFTGRFSYLNTKNPAEENIKAIEKKPNYFDPENKDHILRFGSTGMPGESEIRTAMELELSKGAPISQNLRKPLMSESQFEEAIRRVTEKPNIPKIETNIFGQPTEESVRARGEALLRYTDPVINGQGSGKGMTAQSSTLLEMVRQMGADKFGPNPELVKRASAVFEETKDKIRTLTTKYENGELTKGEFEVQKSSVLRTRDGNSDVIALRDAQSVKEFVFQRDKSGKLVSSRELAGKMSGAICRVLSNYTQAIFTHKTNLSFGEYMINKMQNGDVRMSGGAPVFDMGKMRGFEDRLSKSFDPTGITLQNNFPDLSFKDGKIVGVTNPINIDAWNKFVKSLPEGAAIQVWGNTDSTLGPNHFWILYKKGGVMYDYNNNGERNEYTGKANEFDFLENSIYGIYY